MSEEWIVTHLLGAAVLQPAVVSNARSFYSLTVTLQRGPQ